MKTFHFLSTAIAALALTLPAFANVHSDRAATLAGHVDRLVAEAKKAQTEAREIAALLKAKNPDLAAINLNMHELADRTGQLAAAVSDLEAMSTGFSEKQNAEFDRIKTAVTVLKIFQDNKSEILAGAGALEKRNLLRAKADGIAKRAELVQLAAHRLRG